MDRRLWPGKKTLVMMRGSKAHRTAQDGARKRHKAGEHHIVAGETHGSRSARTRPSCAWGPPVWGMAVCVLAVLTVARCTSALYNVIHDCDETYNYWEPTHLLLYQLRRGDARYGGMALQTWEYSPVYALRSWLYLSVHAWMAEWLVMAPMAMVADVVRPVHVFYGIRLCLAVICALCETLFLYGVYRLTVVGSSARRRSAVNSNMHRSSCNMVTVGVCALLMIFSSGMFNASTSYLPSSFTMCLLMAAIGCWYAMHGDEVEDNEEDRRKRKSSRQRKSKSKWLVALIAFTGIAGIVGWPFCIVSVLPMAVDLLRRFNLGRLLGIALPMAAVLFGATLYYDTAYYGAWILSPLNLLMYNKGSGSELYGVEPWHFYFKNLMLNFNVAFLLALIAPVLILLFGWKEEDEESSSTQRKLRQRLQLITYIAPFHLWFFFFTALAHKEERFLSVVYPVLCLAAAIALEIISQQVHNLFRTWKKYLKRIIIGVVLLIFVLLCISRTLAIVRYYHAPLDLYHRLHDTLGQTNREEITTRDGRSQLNICVGDEWYRYPGSFFLPDNRATLQFVRAGFRGLLPKHYRRGTSATSVVPTHMNDNNREEMSRYISMDQCDYVVDFDFADKMPLARNDSKTTWQTLYEIPFVDANRSRNLLARTLYIPFYSERRNVFGQYRLWKRISSTKAM